MQCFPNPSHCSQFCCSGQRFILDTGSAFENGNNFSLINFNPLSSESLTVQCISFDSEYPILRNPFLLSINCSLTYDGAANNFAFSASSRVAGLSAAERTERRIVSTKYERIEKRRCIVHRYVKVFKHAYVMIPMMVALC